jgi:hypothetical protein
VKVVFGIDLQRWGLDHHVRVTTLLDEHLHLGTVLVVISAQNLGGVAAIGEEVGVKFHPAPSPW